MWWSKRCGPGLPCSTSPNAAITAAIVYDPVNDRVVLYGGRHGPTEYDETWVFAEQPGCPAGVRCWQELDASGPGRRLYPSMIYDESRQSVVLFGGQYEPPGSTCPPGAVFDGDTDCFYHDTWELQGSTWQLIDTPVHPAPRADAAFAWDSDRQQGILVGGRVKDGAVLARLGDTWVWRKGSWSPLTVSGERPLDLEDGAPMVYDRGQGQFIVPAGKTGQTDPPPGLWRLYVGAEERATALTMIDWNEAGVAGAGVQIVGATLVAHGVGAGNTNGPGAEPAFGLRIMPWDGVRQRWREAVGEAASAAELQVLEVEVTEDAPGLIDPGTRTVFFRVQPLVGQGNGDEPGQLDLDYVEARIRYRYPQED